MNLLPLPLVRASSGQGVVCWRSELRRARAQDHGERPLVADPIARSQGDQGVKAIARRFPTAPKPSWFPEAASQTGDGVQIYPWLISGTRPSMKARDGIRRKNRLGQANDYSSESPPLGMRIGSSCVASHDGPPCR
jgi:hypothetical protein